MLGARRGRSGKVPTPGSILKVHTRRTPGFRRFSQQWNCSWEGPGCSWLWKRGSGSRKGLKEPAHNSKPMLVGMGRIGSVVAATFHSPDPIPRLGHRDTQKRVEMWSQVPHNVQNHVPIPVGNRALIFQASQTGLSYKVLSVWSFFSPLKKKPKPTNTNKKKRQAKVLASVCPKARRQDRMWENCHHLLPKYQPSTGAIQTTGLGAARNYPNHHAVPLPLKESAVLVLVSGQGALLR